MRILFLDLDTLRPDHLGCYGYHRNTSPNLDWIASQGIRFDNYYCSDAPCLPSRAALMTGRFGIHSGIVNHGGTTADLRLEGASRQFRTRLDAWGEGAEALPMIFRQAGLHTTTISPFGERHSAWWFYAGFNEMHNTGKGGNESAEDVTPTVLKWIAANARQDNWFLHVNYWDPHTSYRAPADFGNPFADDPLPGWITPEIVERQQQSVGPHTAREVMMYDSKADSRTPRHPGEIRNMADVRRMFDGYDCGIRYMDDHIGQVLDALRREGVMDDLAIVVSSDHAENMGELDIYGEHATADHANCRIPMLLRWPGGGKGTVDTGLHYNLDLGPTLAGLLGQKQRERWDGQSYAPAILEGLDCGRPSLVLSQCAHVCQRGVRWGDYLYMRTYHDGYHLWPTEMLFDLARDPHEQRDLAPERPDLCREGVYILNQWHDDMMRTMPDAVDPLWLTIREGGPLHARGFLPAYCERLEKTGRGWAVAELKRRHPYEFDAKVRP